MLKQKDLDYEANPSYIVKYYLEKIKLLSPDKEYQAARMGKKEEPGHMKDIPENPISRVLKM